MPNPKSMLLNDQLLFSYLRCKDQDQACINNLFSTMGFISNFLKCLLKSMKFIKITNIELKNIVKINFTFELFDHVDPT
jgi:hypothetical protein